MQFFFVYVYGMKLPISLLQSKLKSRKSPLKIIQPVHLSHQNTSAYISYKLQSTFFAFAYPDILAIKPLGKEVQKLSKNTMWYP